MCRRKEGRGEGTSEVGDRPAQGGRRKRSDVCIQISSSNQARGWILFLTTFFLSLLARVVDRFVSRFVGVCEGVSGGVSEWHTRIILRCSCDESGGWVDGR